MVRKGLVKAKVDLTLGADHAHEDFHLVFLRYLDCSMPFAMQFASFILKPIILC